MYEFDKIDIKIINFLLEDGRMTASEIAHRMKNIQSGQCVIAWIAWSKRGGI